MRLPMQMAAGAALAMIGCAHPVGSDGSASAVLRDSAGREVGTARVTQSGTALRLSLRVNGVKAGTLGTHLHAVGRCDPPDFASAGPHWNPTQRQHGRDNPAGMHRGDLPNMMVDAAGRGRLQATIAQGSMVELMDTDGAAIVIHAGPDDYRTDPSGNSGGRVACGVFAAS